MLLEFTYPKDEYADGWRKRNMNNFVSLISCCLKTIKSRLKHTPCIPL